MGFRIMVKHAYIDLIVKLKDKCLLSYSIVRNLQGFESRILTRYYVDTQFMINGVLKYMMKVGRVGEGECDQVTTVMMRELKKFGSYVDRVDTL